MLAACGASVKRMELAPFSAQVLDAAKRVTERSGIDGDPIPLGSKDPKYNDYLDRVRRMIKEKWAYPCVKDAATGLCYYKSTRLVIVFGILKDGHVPWIEVAQKAGYAIYDDYAANAIRLAQPFPTVPDPMVQDRTGVIVVVDFKYVYSPTGVERLINRF
jgi:outer membrane biosynthesis protein TonB